MSILKQYIKEMLNELNTQFLVFVRVGNDVVSNKSYFTNILSSISDFTNKAKGKMQNARQRSLDGKNEWVYIVSFPDAGKQKRFMDELSKLHPEIEIKIPENNDVQK